MNMANKAFLLSLFLCLSFSTIAFSGDDCVYTVFVRTGSIIKGGTDSKISLRLFDTKGYYLEISDIETWGGLMGPGYNYFERGNLDIFSGRGPCLTTPVCAVNVTSDGSGPHHGWYCNYVEVTMTGVHRTCSQKQFDIDRWLATDTAPYSLTAVANFCPYIIPDLNDLTRRISSSGSSALRGLRSPL